MDPSFFSITEDDLAEIDGQTSLISLSLARALKYHAGHPPVQTIAAVQEPRARGIEPGESTRGTEQLPNGHSRYLG